MADDTYRDLLEHSVSPLSSPAADNTVILFISDHGYRFGKFRESFLGYYEESLPFFYLKIPPTLKTRYPDWHRHLKENAQKLTTPLDLFETFSDLLQLATKATQVASTTDSYENTFHNPYPFLLTRSPKFRTRYSLFEEIPTNRTCSSSGIPERYCMCGVNSENGPRSNVSKSLGKAIVSQVNSKVSSIWSRKCLALGLSRIIYNREVGRGSVQQEMAKKSVLRKMEVRLRALRTHGFMNLTLHNWEDEQNVTIITTSYVDYLIAIETTLNFAHFEAKLRVYDNGTWHTLGDISRINSYKGESDCMEDPLLKPFCLCEDAYDRLVAKNNKKKKLDKKKKKKVKPDKGKKTIKAVITTKKGSAEKTEGTSGGNITKPVIFI